MEQLLVASGLLLAQGQRRSACFHQQATPLPHCQPADVYVLLETLHGTLVCFF
jgi:hypothetical protein